MQVGVMIMQKKITVSGNLLDKNGHLVECGYATTLIKNYDRSHIKARKLRIKEWDYYLVYNSKYAVALTIDDNSYMGLNSFSLIDFENKVETTKSFMSIMTKGKTGLPSTSKSGDVAVEKKNYSLSFKNDGKTRVLSARIDKFKDDKTLTCEFVLTEEPKDSMVIVTPFKKKPTHFYYNQKIVGFKVSGYVSLGEDKIVEFDAKDSRGILDWGRGVWTYKNTWFWGAGAGIVDGKEVGFNIGYGFGDTSAATENMVFVDGKAFKLESVKFEIPKDKKGKDDYMSPWKFTSSDGSFKMDFTPIINRSANIDVGIIGSNQNQVFGYFNGIIKLSDGRAILLKDYLAFAEKVKNKW